MTRGTTDRPGAGPLRRRRRAGRLADAARLVMREMLRPLADLGRFSHAPPRERRLVLVQADGVSRRRLEGAMADGWMPYLADLLVLLALRESGDIVVQGWRGEGRDIVAYAWEFGSHGGVAPEELESFVAHPADCAIPFRGALRPSDLHAWFETLRGGSISTGWREPEASVPPEGSTREGGARASPRLD